MAVLHLNKVEREFKTAAAISPQWATGAQGVWETHGGFKGWLGIRRWACRAQNICETAEKSEFCGKMILKSSFIELGKKRWWVGAVSKASDVVTGVGAQPQLTDLVLVLAHWPCLPSPCSGSRDCCCCCSCCRSCSCCKVVLRQQYGPRW